MVNSKSRDFLAGGDKDTGTYLARGPILKKRDYVGRRMRLVRVKKGRIRGWERDSQGGSRHLLHRKQRLPTPIWSLAHVSRFAEFNVYVKRVPAKKLKKKKDKID